MLDSHLHLLSQFKDKIEEEVSKKHIKWTVE